MPTLCTFINNPTSQWVTSDMTVAGHWSFLCSSSCFQIFVWVITQKIILLAPSYSLVNCSFLQCWTLFPSYIILVHTHTAKYHLSTLFPKTSNDTVFCSPGLLLWKAIVFYDSLPSSDTWVTLLPFTMPLLMSPTFSYDVGWPCVSPFFLLFKCFSHCLCTASYGPSSLSVYGPSVPTFVTSH